MTQKTLCKSLLFIFILSLDEGMYTFDNSFHLDWNYQILRGIISDINTSNISMRFLLQHGIILL